MGRGYTGITISSSSSRGTNKNRTSTKSSPTFKGYDSSVNLTDSPGSFSSGKMVDLDSIKAKIDSLVQYSNYSIKEISAPVHDQLDRTLGLINLVQEGDAYAEIIEHVKSRFGGESVKILPDTVGAVFIGCMASSTHPIDGSVHCARACAGNLHPDVDFSLCTHNVYKLSQGSLERTVEADSTHAIIHADDHGVNVLNSSNLRDLTRMGIKTLTVIYSDRKGEVVNIVKDISVSDASGDIISKRLSSGIDCSPQTSTSTSETTPSTSSTSTSSTSSSKSRSRKIKDNSGPNWLTIIIFILLFIIIICIALYWVYSSGHFGSKVEETTTSTPFETVETTVSDVNDSYCSPGFV